MRGGVMLPRKEKDSNIWSQKATAKWWSNQKYLNLLGAIVVAKCQWVDEISAMCADVFVHIHFEYCNSLM